MDKKARKIRKAAAMLLAIVLSIGLILPCFATDYSGYSDYELMYQMAANSQAWKSADSTTRNELSAKNKEIRAELESRGYSKKSEAESRRNSQQFFS